MFLKRRTRTKDGKTHIYYSVCESLRVSRDRVVQRQILHLGELNTTQIDSWQHSIDVLAHKPALEQHLAAKWKDLFGATFDLLLYDLTSTYFEGDVDALPKARRGYSRDHRPDCKQLVLALIVTPEGFPLTYEVFPGNRLDRTTLQDILDTIEKKFGKARRLWVFDRGIVSEDNLELLRQRGAHYLVGTPRSQLKAYEQKLLEGNWQKVSDTVQVQLLPETDEVSVLCRSTGRVQKERAMRRRRLRWLIGDLRGLRRRVREGQLKQRELIQRAIGRLQERHPQAWRWLNWELHETDAGLAFDWDWDREKFQTSARAEGAYLLRAHWTERDPAKLWQTYVQLTEAEAAFRTLKSEVKVRPIWHWTEKRVEAHVLVAFLGYCLWVCLKKKSEPSAPSLTPWQILDQLGRTADVPATHHPTGTRASRVVGTTEVASAAATPATCVCPRPAAGGAGTRGTAGRRLNLCGRPAPFAGHNSLQINPHVVSRAKVRLILRGFLAISLIFCDLGVFILPDDCDILF